MDLHPNVKEVVINNTMRPMGRATIGGPEEGKMEINLRAGDVVNTIIHENLHLIDPAMPHGQMYRESDRIESKMSLPQMAHLLLQAHERSQCPVHHREIVHTYSSKVISSNVK